MGVIARECVGVIVWVRMGVWGAALIVSMCLRVCVCVCACVCV